MRSVPRALIVGIEAVGKATFDWRPRVPVRPGSVGSLGAMGGGARSDIVLKPQRPHAIAQLLLLNGGSFAFCFNLGFALAVGRLGLLEDIDNVLALRKC